MSVSSTMETSYGGLQEIDETLARMMRRLHALINVQNLTQDMFVEISSIYNNVSYIFLYLESNAVHINYDCLLPWSKAFHSDSKLDRRILELLKDLRCNNPDAEESRYAYIEYLCIKLSNRQCRTSEALDNLQVEAKKVLQEIQADQFRLLKRLGANIELENAQASFYNLVSRTEKAEIRSKLSQAWTQTRDCRLESMVEIVDKMIAVRKIQSKERDYESVLAQTLERCRISESTAWAYIERYLIESLESHERLEEEIQNTISTFGKPTDHFGYYLRTLQGGKNIPLFSLNGCLNYISSVAVRLFGLTLEVAHPKSSDVITVDVSLNNHQCGQINFDLWDDETKRRSANYTRGLRNRTDWDGLVQQPVAYVSCRFKRRQDGASLITFQNVHSLFHEFGHAINHLLIRKRLPNQSGLEYLPLERLENLSMWFEKWVYHPEFANSLSLSSIDKDGLALAQNIKMLEYRRTHVDRAVTAALDFDVHTSAGRGIRQSFDMLNDKFGISRYCKLGDFSAYFTWPMLQANPGAYFAYIWGSADSAKKFAPLMEKTFENMPSHLEVYNMFSECFNFNESSTEPDTGSIFSFYEHYQYTPKWGRDK